jgi:hypothetical protein
MVVDVPDKTKISEKLPTFYHEMGHKIYFEAMAKAIPEIQQQRSAIDGYVKYMHDCAADAKACADDQPKKDMYKAVDSFTDDFDTFIYITTPYNELFADVVSALASGDRDALARTLGPCTYSDPACEYRAFSKNTIDKFAGENAHSRFSSLRRDLWEGWVQPRLGDKPALLVELGDLFVAESLGHFKEDFKLIEGMASLVQNKRLRELLKLKVTEPPTLNYELP